MSLARRLMAASANLTPSPAGQQEWTTPGAYDFEVPADVHFISAAVIGGGGRGSSASPFPGGGGGGLHWRNLVPVTPGETLTVVVGIGAANGGVSQIKRGSTVLLEATGGNTLGGGGKGRFDLYGGGGGDGGTAPSGPGNGGLGGGAAGYVGNGGRGGNIYGPAGQYPAVDSGGGRGGNSQTPGNTWPGAAGEGVGLQGRTADKAYGSLGAVKCGAGNPNQAFGGVGPGPDQHGGARIMWGDGRSYPDAAADI